MSIELDDVRAAARLLHCALDVRLRASESEYRVLVARYLDQHTFRSLVEGIAEGLRLEVLDASHLGMVVAPMADSVFTFPPADFRGAAREKVDVRLLDGLVQLAIAATLFPRARDLEEDATVVRPPVTVDEVEEMLRRICDRLAEDARSRPDPPATDEEEGLLEAWRVYARQPSIPETKERQGQHGTRKAIKQNLERLREHGCFVRTVDGGVESWAPTWRYQVLVKEMAAGMAFERVRAALERPAGGG